MMATNCNGEGGRPHPEEGYKIQLHKDNDGPDHFLDINNKFQKMLYTKSGTRVKNKSILDIGGRLSRKLGLKLSHFRPLYVLLHQLENIDSKTNPSSFIMKLLHHSNHNSSAHYNARFYIEPETHITETLTLE
jgi:hypothetical protein